jgi:hypothetical protein
MLATKTPMIPPQAPPAYYRFFSLTIIHLHPTNFTTPICFSNIFSIERGKQLVAEINVRDGLVLDYLVLK